ncbi:hypothetical protein J5U21_00179 [Saccharolobus shibatae]|uniref:Uncharacterized protein n=1 Tax=Saccharolobus shibatae TaxID=2286 RepID=A0A8F5BSI2_9CREN|nr:hypothetical protein J5U21_00179 [Saccharolobus shibatae]
MQRGFVKKVHSIRLNLVGLNVSLIHLKNGIIRCKK